MIVAEEVSLAGLCAQYTEAKRAENAASAKAKKLREEILKLVPEDPAHETQEVAAGVKVIYKNVSFFSDDIVEFLEGQGYNEAIIKKPNPDRLSSLIDVGLLTTDQISPFYVEKWNTSLVPARG